LIKRRNEEDDAIFSLVSKAIDGLIASQDGLTAVTALRESEELCASRQAKLSNPIAWVSGTVREAGFVSFNDIFGKRRNEEDDAIFSLVSKAIDDLIASQDGLTVAPLGCGNHIDHRIVHRSVLASFKVRKGIQVGFYEDLPYSAFLPESEILARIPRFPGVSMYRKIKISRSA
jgi:hypothetical protein